MSRSIVPMRRPAVLAAVLASLALGSAYAQQGTAPSAPPPNAQTAQQSPAMSGNASKQIDSGERRFVEKAALGGMAEVQMGELAQQKAQSEAVKQFGSRMVQDHSKANDELKQVASTKGLQVPTALDRGHRKDYEKLQKLQGAEFDRAYMKHMVSDHKDDVSDFEKQAKNAKDPDIKAFAQKTLPTLQQHRQLAESTYDSVKNAGKGGRGE